MVTRTVLRGVSRSILREVWRTVIPYDGPSLEAICSLLSAYVRLAEKHERKRKAERQPKFETLCTPEESRRKFLADLERCYGSGAKKSDQPPAQPPHSTNLVASPAVTAAPLATAKKDIVSVPLAYTGDGLLGLDWSHAK